MLSRTLFLAVLLAATAACTSDEGSLDSTPDSSTPTTSIEVTATTDSVVTSTSEPTTTEAVPEVSDEEAVAAVHTRFMTEVFDRDERIEGEGDRVLQLVNELTTGPLLARFQSDTPERIAAGDLIVGPGYDSNVVAIEVVGDTANIVDCSQDRNEGYDAAGQLTIAADDFFKLRSTRLVRIDGVWLVEEFFTGGDDRCNPDDS